VVRSGISVASVSVSVSVSVSASAAGGKEKNERGFARFAKSEREFRPSVLSLPDGQVELSA